MCGIVKVKRNDGHSPIKPLIERYHKQKSRGQQGYGFIAVKDGKVIGYERSRTFDEIEKKIDKYQDATDILFHHRFPTSTENLEETAHPIHVSNKLLKNDYYLVHNGVIGNSRELKQEHEKLGFMYNTEVEIFSGHKQKHGSNKKKKHKISSSKIEFNDSESLAIEFALWNEGLKDTVDTRGSVAFICYEVDKKSKKVLATHYGRNINPLKIFSAHGMQVLSSESTDQGHVDIEPDKCFTFNHESKEISIRELELRTSFSSTGNTGRSTSPSSDVKYPDYSHSHGIGYDVRPLLPAGTATKSTGNNDGDKQTHILLGEDDLAKINHGFGIRCIHGASVGVECHHCNFINLKDVCSSTKKKLSECFCNIHRARNIDRHAIEKNYRNASKPIVIGTPTGDVKKEPEGIRTPYFHQERKCAVCKIDSAGMFYSGERNDWVHYACENDGEKDDGDEFIETLKRNYKKLEEEIEIIDEKIDDRNNLIEQLERMKDAIVDKPEHVNDWCKHEFKIEDIKVEIRELNDEREKKQSDLDKADNFIAGRWF